MSYPTGGRSIVTSLVWGILMTCVCGSPAEVSGQPERSVPEDTSDASTEEEARAGIRSVPVRDVEDLDGLTRLLWTLQMIFTPSALAHVSPLYAYDPRELAGRTVHPDRIGDVAVVRTCRTADGGVLVFSPPEEVVEQDHGILCANYMSDTIDAFHSAYELVSATPRPEEDTTSGEVYFGTTYPIPGIEPEKRFVAERRR